MRKLLIIASVLTITVAMASCKGAGGDYPGDAYAPDMYYSRAYETYAYNSNDAYNSLKKRGIRYDAVPVAGTIARGDMSAYPYPNTDSGYTQAAGFRNPFDTAVLNAATLKEAERLYLVNCGICHGAKLDGNGPLWKDGNGPYPAAPPNLLDDARKALSDGQIYHVITHGKGQMGSYASQVHPEQRWWIVEYIRSKQGGLAAASGAAADSATVTTATTADTTTAQQ
jgi:mono/diheme cytochrome c family protein